MTDDEYDDVFGSGMAAENSGRKVASADPTTRRDRRSPWLLLGAVAGVIALIAGGLVTVLGGDRGDTIVPATDVSDTGGSPTTPTTVASVPATTTAPETSAPRATAAVDSTPTTVVPAGGGEPGETEDEGEALQIERACVSEFDCTQLANTADGRIVAYDPVDSALRVYDPDGNELRGDVPIDSDVPLERAALVAVGPADVAYLRIPTPGSTDPSNDLLAIPLAGESAGTVVTEWTGLDGSGDSTLVPRRAGLTVVACCGPRVTRPADDAPIYRWVDREGAVAESDAPSFELNLGEAGNSLTRIDGESTFTRYALPTVLQYPRDFPHAVPTDNGGALVGDFVQFRSGGATVIVEFGPDWPDNGNVHYLPSDEGTSIALLEPSGTVVVSDADSFVRRQLDEVATPGWPGRIESDPDGTLRAPGLNDYIGENSPYWARDPELFALQLKQRLGANERVTIEYGDAPAPEIAITTDGFLDDSVTASRQSITTERGDDGLLRFVSGTTTFRCQPGRGHQDFSSELCI